MRGAGDLLVDRTTFVEGAADFLPDVLDAAVLFAGSLAEDRERFAVEEEFAGAAFVEACEAAGERRLATPGAADHADAAA
ncbi:hypothetical protein GCM10009745_08920 [Kribbella yunnanensis]|uniref:Uncharacterized protein n=1 Tax=Kribbella yunnanensis TaxID=190194 RepID=A0ABN2GBT6_9ACTN